MSSPFSTFPFSDEHQMLRETLRELVREKIAPRAMRLDETHEFPSQALAELGELGLLGVWVPEVYGGAGMDFVAYIIAMEELARGCGSTCLTYTAHTGLCVTPLMLLGTEEQKLKYLPALCSGAEIGCFGLTEPSSGSDSGSLSTRAERDGSGWRLSGSKMWITNASHARRMVCCAKTDPAQPRSKGISAFVVDMQSPGVSVPKVEDKLGLRASATCQVFLDNVFVEDTDVLGEIDTGFPVFMKTLEGGRVAIAAMSLGLAVEAFERALRYSQQRETFGRPLAGHQTVQAYLADMATEIEAARLLVYQAAFMKSAGLSVGREGAMAKLYASEMAMRVCDRAIQIHGGYGYVREFEVERMWRDAKLCTIGEGTSEIQQIVIARQLLGSMAR